MKERGAMAGVARSIAAKHGVSLRQAYRYARSGRTPSEDVRVGSNGQRYHVWLSQAPFNPVEAQRIRYMVATVAKKACAHGITEHDLAELERASEHLAAVIAAWKAASRPESGQL